MRLRARKTFSPRFTVFFTDLRKKKMNVLQSKFLFLKYVMLGKYIDVY